MSSTRRHFLQGASAAGLAVPLLAQGRKISANDRLNYALIGNGNVGHGDAESALKQRGVHLVAVADVYEGRLVRAKERWGNDLFTTRDYREVLKRPDIDAVLIATPDHWHAQITTDALNAGKAVYCEKPMVKTPEDGTRVVDVWRKTKGVMQVGSQGVSSIIYAKAKELVAQGAIGQVTMVDAWYDRNSAVGAWQYAIPPDASEQTIDWDRFLGSAPKRPFEPIRLFRWRNYQDYGTGIAGDLFVHLFSGLHYIMGVDGPARVFATGGLRDWKDGRDVPDIMVGIYDYPVTAGHAAFNVALKVNFESGAGETHGFRFVGSEGVMSVGNGVTISKQPRETAPGYTIETFSKPIQDKFKEEYFRKYPVQQ